MRQVAAATPDDFDATVEPEQRTGQLCGILYHYYCVFPCLRGYNQCSILPTALFSLDSIIYPASLVSLCAVCRRDCGRRSEGCCSRCGTEGRSGQAHCRAGRREGG